MKKIFLTVLTLGFLATAFVSCQSNTKKAEVKDSVIAEKIDTSKSPLKLAIPEVSPVAPTTAEIEKSKVEAPNFSDADVNEGIKEFSVIKAEYETALKNNSKEAIQAAKDKYAAWVTKAATWGSKFPAKEKQAYIDYYQKLALQWDILTRQATKK